jgi:hypothetical protein
MLNATIPFAKLRITQRTLKIYVKYPHFRTSFARQHISNLKYTICIC